MANVSCKPLFAAATATTKISVQRYNEKGNNGLCSTGHPCLLLGNAGCMHCLSPEIRKMNKFMVDYIFNGNI